MVVALNFYLTEHHPLDSAKPATDTQDQTGDSATNCIEWSWRSAGSESRRWADADAVAGERPW